MQSPGSVWIRNVPGPHTSSERESRPWTCHQLQSMVFSKTRLCNSVPRLCLSRCDGNPLLLRVPAELGGRQSALAASQRPLSQTSAVMTNCRKPGLSSEVFLFSILSGDARSRGKTSSANGCSRNVSHDSCCHTSSKRTTWKSRLTMAQWLWC